MEAKFNVTKEQRKELVNILGEYLNVKPKYLGMPSASYQIGKIEVDKTGRLIFDEEINSITVNEIVNELVENGFEFDSELNEDLTIEINNLSKDSKSTKSTGIESFEDKPISNLEITVSKLNMDESKILNLKNLLKSKSTLVKKALNVEELDFTEDENNIIFSWFKDKNINPTEANVYVTFIGKLCELATKQHRISPVVKTVANEKYAFRCFLLRLDFIGDEFKYHRKLLLKNFEGPSAFKVKTEAMNFPSDDIVSKVKEQYKEGLRVELLKMDDASAPPIGTRGTVYKVDSTGSILVNWDNGSKLNVLYGVDKVKIVDEEKNG